MVRSIEGAWQAMETKVSPFWRCLARGHLFDLFQGLRPCLEAGSAEAARHTGMNRDAFSRRVKAETGQTFLELVTDLRLRKAGWQVRQTLLPLARVAEEVGLRDQTHFTRLFKAHYGAAPSRYRLGQKKADHPKLADEIPWSP